MDFLQVYTPLWSLTHFIRRWLTGLKRLARVLDQPFIPWKRLIVGFSIAQYLFESYLSLRQYRVLQAKKPPKSLEGIVSQEDYDKSQVGPRYQPPRCSHGVEVDGDI